MKLNAQREPLAAAFATAAVFVSRNSSIDALRNVKLTADAEGVTLTATDMEVGCRINVEGVEVESPGEALLPVDRFGGIVKEGGDKTLRIETTDRHVVVKGEMSSFKIAATSPGEFPAVPLFDAKSYHSLKAAAFKAAIARTEFACDVESARYVLGGVLIELEGSQFCAVGTDGRRLSAAETSAECVGGHKTNGTNVIRRAAICQLSRAIGDSPEANLDIHFRNNDVLLRTAAGCFYARLLEGRFPRWRDFFSARRDVQTVSIGVGPLLAAVRQVSLMVDEATSGIYLKFTEGYLTLTANVADRGESSVAVVVAYDGPATTIKVNHLFVQQFLRTLDGESQVDIEFDDPEASVLFRPADGFSQYTLMPLKQRER